MAWFSNGRKYWKHKGRIYSCRAKKHRSSVSGTKYNFSYSSDINRYHSDLEKNQDAWMDALDSMAEEKEYSKRDYEMEKRLEKANDDYLDSMFNAVEYDEIEF